MDQNISGRAKQGREKISSHEPEVEQGAMGVIVSPFQRKQSSAQDTMVVFYCRNLLHPLVQIIKEWLKTLARM